MSSVPGWRPLALPLAACLTVASAAPLAVAEDKRPVGRTIIEAAPEATKDVVVGGKQTWNVYFSCSNGADTVKPKVSISPPPAHADEMEISFSPDPVDTLPAKTTLTIQTRSFTRPVKNGYSLTIFGTGTKCTTYPAVNPKPILMVRPKIVIRDKDGPAEKEAWWFNRVTTPPRNYSNVSVPLTPFPLPRNPSDKYAWTIREGASYAKFRDGGSTSITGETPVHVVGKAVPPANSGDVSVTVKVDGVESAEVKLKIKAPRKLAFKFAADKAHAQYGYVSSIHYELRDQYGKPLPRKIEWFAEHDLEAGGIDTVNNWFPDFPNFGEADPLDLIATVRGCKGQIPAGYCTNPSIVSPTHPQAGTKIIHWPGSIFVGSTTGGVRVASLMWRMFRGYGRHCNIKSPPDAAALTPACPK